MSTSSISITDIDQLAIATIRTLAMDAVEAANSGHPGTPMALAPIAYSIYQNELRYNPDDPTWISRDRFILSCGHASMLLYAMLHLCSVKQVDDKGLVTDELAVPLDHIKKFRQLHTRCPGHPEYGETSGVETTTGPLGQGIANSVGMAMAERWLAARYNKPGFNLFDYNIYVLCSDGDLMEGVGAEAASLAGHLKLSNLCWIYDDNSITIEGDTSLAFSEDVAGRFESYGWRVLRVDDANDLDALAKAFKAFHAEKDAPTMIIVRSTIAWGAPNKAGTHGAHGAPLGAEEIRLTKAAYGWPENEQFLVPPEVVSHFDEGIGQRGREAQKKWNELHKEYAKKYPELAREIEQIVARQLPEGWDSKIPTFPADPKGMATRVSGGKVLNAVAEQVPWLLGGSADLAPSTMTRLTFEGAGDFEAGSYGGRNMHFGIREHAMAAAMNGMSLCGLRAFGSTFLVFSDYLRPSVRLAAVMQTPSIFVFTHDSLGVGEDGPTHQPVEHVAALRAIPGLITIRPGDANEVAAAYRTIMPFKKKPVALVLTRQNLPTLDRTKYASADGVARGAYVLADAKNGKPDVILIGTGSEVSLCVQAYEELTAQGIAARVVSMPSFELFEEQDEKYRESVLPPGVKARVAVEMGIKQGWERYLGESGRFVGMNSFGASAPGNILAQVFGFTVENVVKQAKATIGAK